MYKLLLPDVNEQEVLAWLIECIGPLKGTSTDVVNEFSYVEIFRGGSKGSSWKIETIDVSDVSGQWDTMTEIEFDDKDDAMFAAMRWGGNIQ